MRLGKFIANSGFCSRRKVKEYLENNKVLVNGNLTKDFSLEISSRDRVIINKKTLRLPDLVTYILNKPEKCISTTNDEKGRKTVVECIRTRDSIYPVGRLDYNTKGLILLTNDGDFANRMMKPNNEILKVYMAKFSGFYNEREIKAFVKDKKTKENGFIGKIKIELVSFNQPKRNGYLKIYIYSGKNHVIKNILSDLNLSCLKLKRIQYHFLGLNNLSDGQYIKANRKIIDVLNKTPEEEFYRPLVWV